MYDFGGLAPGNSLMESNARSLVSWACDHPSALVLVVSAHTFNVFVRYELEEILEREQSTAPELDAPYDSDARAAYVAKRFPNILHYKGALIDASLKGRVEGRPSPFPEWWLA